MNFKSNETIKKRSMSQIVMIAVTFIVTVGMAAFLIYYVGNWIAGLIQWEWAGSAVFFIIVMIVMTFAIYSFNKLTRKIINKI